MLQLLYLYFYLFLSLCRAIPYVRCLTSSVDLKNPFHLRIYEASSS